MMSYIGFAVFVVGIAALVMTIAGDLPEVIGAKLFKKTVTLPVFRSDNIIIPYTVSTEEVFDNDGFSTYYTYYLKYVKTKDGKKYPLFPSKVYANDKEIETASVPPSGVIITTKEPIEELRIDGITFRPDTATSTQWEVDADLRVNFNTGMVYVSVLIIVMGILFMLI